MISHLPVLSGSESVTPPIFLPPSIFSVPSDDRSILEGGFSVSLKENVRLPPPPPFRPFSLYSHSFHHLIAIMAHLVGDFSPPLPPSTGMSFLSFLIHFCFLSIRPPDLTWPGSLGSRRPARLQRRSDQYVRGVSFIFLSLNTFSTWTVTRSP